VATRSVRSPTWMVDHVDGKPYEWPQTKRAMNTLCKIFTDWPCSTKNMPAL
jgi:hypothetical protein